LCQHRRLENSENVVGKDGVGGSIPLGSTSFFKRLGFCRVTKIITAVIIHLEPSTGRGLGSLLLIYLYRAALSLLMKVIRGIIELEELAILMHIQGTSL
jgi:hypothetical protein